MDETIILSIIKKKFNQKTYNNILLSQIVENHNILHIDIWYKLHNITKDILKENLINCGGKHSKILIINYTPFKKSITSISGK